METQIVDFNGLSDEKVMEYLQGGNERAFEEITHRFQERLTHFLFRFTRNRLDAEDLCQETLFRLFKARNSYVPLAKFSTWLFTIASNLAKTHYKKSSRMHITSIQDSVESEESQRYMDLPDHGLLPDRVTEDRMVMKALYEALEKLPEDFKQVVVLRDLQNLSYEEIEEITGLAMGTVKSRINRGRVRLQALLKNVVDPETYFS